MAGYQGFNPYGGYGMPQMMAQQAAQQAYSQQMQAVGQMYPQQTAQQPSVNVRLVTSRDEAAVAQIPFDSTVNVFVNMAAGEVYIKRFNPNTGGAWWREYIDVQRMSQMQQAKPAQEEQDEPAAYVTQARFEELESRVSELSEAITGQTRGGKKDE